MFPYCTTCKVQTEHTENPRRCKVCVEKDRQDMEEALERFRVAEGAYDPFQGDMFAIGESDDPC